MNRQERAKFVSSYSKVLTQSWGDPGYRSRLVAEPAAVLGEAGIPVPGGTRVSILDKQQDGELEDQVKLWETGLAKGAVDLYVPATPQLAEGDISDQQLEAVAGGGDCCCSCCPCCTCT